MIPVNTPAFKGNEKKYLIECIDTGWVSSDGPFVKKFEGSFADYVDRTFGVAVCNGTAAIDVAVRSLNLKPGDEIILPTFTIISCVLEIVRSGIKPVFVDSNLENWNLDVNELRQKITSKTKAILIVHTYSFPCDMDPILEIAKENKLWVIEDSAEMHGQDYKGKKCGSFGDISTFSFYPHKHITTGEGGMILTNNEELNDRCRSLRNLCFNNKRRFVHEELGFNYRMSNLQAAVGLAQLEYLDKTVERKREIGNMYRSLLKTSDNYSILPDKLNYAMNIYWVFGILLNSKQGKDAYMIMEELAKEGIGTRPFFYPLHKQPALASHIDVSQTYDNAETLSKYGFYVPSGLGISNEEVKITANHLNNILTK